MWRHAREDLDGEHAEACGCWIWMGGTDKNGVPICRHEKTSTTGARRQWIRENGKPPKKGMVLVADCGNRLCIRPSHHSEVLPTELSYRKGITLLGEGLAEMAYQCGVRGMSHREIGERFGASARTAGRLVHRKYGQLREEKLP